MPELGARQFSLRGALAVLSGFCVWLAIGRVVGIEFLFLTALCIAGAYGLGIVVMAVSWMFDVLSAVVPTRRTKWLWQLWDLVAAVKPQTTERQFCEQLPEFLLKKPNDKNR